MGRLRKKTSNEGTFEKLFCNLRVAFELYEKVEGLTTETKTGFLDKFKRSIYRGWKGPIGKVAKTLLSTGILVVVGGLLVVKTVNLANVAVSVFNPDVLADLIQHISWPEGMNPLGFGAKKIRDANLSAKKELLDVNGDNIIDKKEFEKWDNEKDSYLNELQVTETEIDAAAKKLEDDAHMANID